MRNIFFRAVVMCAQLAVFSGGVYGTMLGFSHYYAENYSLQTSQIPPLFPIVIRSVATSLNDALTFKTIRWSEYGSLLEADRQQLLVLPDGEGQIARQNSSHSRYNYRIRSTKNEQIVDIEENVETGIIYWGYTVKNSEVVPMYRRGFSFAIAGLGIFPGLILSWLVGRVGKRLRNSDGAVAQ